MLSLKSSRLLSCAILLSVTSDVVHSKYVYHPKSHRKIAQYKEVSTWEEAKQRCESEGATLASPISAELLQHMKTIIAVNNHTTSYFIGFKARHTTNGTEFRSEEGILLEDVPESFNMVDLLDTQKGECLCMDGNSIRIESCWSRLPFMCYTNKTSGGVLKDIPAVMSTHKRLHCGPDYKLYPTGCYKVHKEDMNWTSAYWKCALEGAYLAVINDSDEAKVVTEIVTDSGFKWSWVGLRDVSGSQDWAAVTGEKLDDVYHVWAVSASHDTEHACATLLFTEKLDDYPCSHGQQKYARAYLIC